MVGQGNFLANRQAQPSALIAALGRTPETLKQQVECFGADARAKVAHPDGVAADLDCYLRMRWRMLDGILQQFFSVKYTKRCAAIGEPAHIVFLRAAQHQLHLCGFGHAL